MLRLLILTFLTCVFFTYAEENAFYVSQVGTSARMLAIGDIEGFSRSAVNVFENPSSLAFMDSFSISLFKTTLFNEVDYANVAVGLSSKYGHFSIGYMNSSVSGIPKTYLNIVGSNSYVESNGDYGVNFDLFKFGYSFPMKNNLKLGISYSYFQNTIDTLTGQGFNYDIGFFYSLQKFSLSYVIHNFIKSEFINYDDSTFEKIPMHTILGIKYNLDDLDILFQFNFQEGSKILFSLGSIYNPSYFDIVEIMGGLKQQNYLNLSSNHLTLGFGIIIGALGFYYSYEKSDHYMFDNYSYFSLELGG